MTRAHVITCSDGASRGERQDRSGPAIVEILLREGFETSSRSAIAAVRVTERREPDPG